MSDDGSKDQRTGESTVQGQSSIPKIPAAISISQPTPTSIASPDRAELLTRARTFLASPQVQLQDSDTKRAFLAEKGLISSEVDQLLRELPPPVPPRTYPASPPSNLPNLLVGVTRILTWLTGTSATVLLVYYRFLLPRIEKTYQARLALRKHQSVLIARLTESASALKETQTESYKDLPRTVPAYEDPRYAQCRTVDELLSHSKASQEEATQPGVEIPNITILRCALEELSRSKTDEISTEELFRYLEGKLPWLSREEGADRQNDLWNQLNACPLFVSSVPKPDATNPMPVDHPSRLLWKCALPPLPPTPPLFTSLANLQTALPRSQGAVSAHSGDRPLAPTMSARQRTLQVLSDFTGYITTQTYSLGLPSIRSTNGAIPAGDPIEDELRREIRALKGLALNRRSFIPHGSGASGLTSDPPRSSA